MLSADKAHEFLAPAWTCSSAAIARDTGWSAATNLERGVELTLGWYRQQQWL